MGCLLTKHMVLPTCHDDVIPNGIPDELYPYVMMSFIQNSSVLNGSIKQMTRQDPDPFKEPFILFLVWRPQSSFFSQQWLPLYYSSLNLDW